MCDRIFVINHESSAVLTDNVHDTLDSERPKTISNGYQNGNHLSEYIKYAYQTVNVIKEKMIRESSRGYIELEHVRRIDGWR